MRAIACHLLARHQAEVIAFGAGWTDRERQHPVGDTGRSEPRHADSIIAAELDRALADPDPLRGIAQLVSRWAAAFVIDPDGVSKTTGLGADRLDRRLRDALPDGAHPLRAATRALMRPMLSPRLVALNSDAFVVDDQAESTVDLAAHRGASTLADLDLADDHPHAAAA